MESSFYKRSWQAALYQTGKAGEKIFVETYQFIGRINLPVIRHGSIDNYRGFLDTVGISKIISLSELP